MIQSPSTFTKQPSLFSSKSCLVVEWHWWLGLYLVPAGADIIFSLSCSAPDVSNKRTPEIKGMVVASFLLRNFLELTILSFLIFVDPPKENKERTGGSNKKMTY